MVNIHHPGDGKGLSMGWRLDWVESSQVPDLERCSCWGMGLYLGHLTSFPYLCSLNWIGKVTVEGGSGFPGDSPGRGFSGCRGAEMSQSG